MPLTPLGTMKLQTTNEILLWVKTRSHRNFVPPSVFVPTNLSVYKFPFPCQGYFLLNQHVLEERIGRVGKVMDRSIVGQSDRIVYGSWKLNQFPFVRYLVPLHLETHDFVLHPGRRNETPAPTMRLAGVVNDVHKLSMYCKWFCHCSAYVGCLSVSGNWKSARGPYIPYKKWANNIKSTHCLVVSWIGTHAQNVCYTAWLDNICCKPAARRWQRLKAIPFTSHVQNFIPPTCALKSHLHPPLSNLLQLGRLPYHVLVRQ